MRPTVMPAKAAPTKHAFRAAMPIVQLWLIVIIVCFPKTLFAQVPSGAELFAQGDDNGVLPCAACHGAHAQGNSAIGAPKLAGLAAPTIKTALAQIAQTDGGNAAMRITAQSLSPAETDSVAAYLANLK